MKEVLLMYINYIMNQTCLPLELTAFLPENHIVFSIDKIVESLPSTTFEAIYHTYGRPSYHPKVVIKALIFAYSEGVFSGRKIEKMMQENLAMQWLTAQQILSYRTINRFRVSEGMERILTDIYSSFSAQLKIDQLITQQSLFIDGTKFEADANKYTFVWKKATEKYYEKLKQAEKNYYESEIAPMISHAVEKDQSEGFTKEEMEEIQLLIEEELDEMEQDIQSTKEKQDLSNLKKKRRRLKKHRHKIKQDFLLREEKYAAYFDTFGERNSFSKTDPDATFMRMKEDHMMNGQLKAGYNVQIGTENQFVLHCGVFPNPADTRTLIPFIESLPTKLPRTIIADAGYGSEENLDYLVNTGIEAIVKYRLYDKEKKKAYRQSDHNLANWTYVEQEDQYIHPDGTLFRFSHLSNRQRASGYRSQARIYKTTKPEGEGRKSLAVNVRYEEQKQQMKEKLLSEEGGKLFAKRKIEVESVFGQVKANLGFTRLSVRGIAKVTKEIRLLFMANNVKKYNKMAI